MTSCGVYHLSHYLHPLQNRDIGPHAVVSPMQWAQLGQLLKKFHRFESLQRGIKSNILSVSVRVPLGTVLSICRKTLSLLVTTIQMSDINWPDRRSSPVPPFPSFPYTPQSFNLNIRLSFISFQSSLFKNPQFAVPS